MSRSLGPVSSRPPRPKRWSSQRKFLTGGSLSLLFLGAVVVVLWWTGAIFGKQPFTGTTWTVRKEKLKVTIVARGSLESASYGDIYCKVRSGTKGSTNATTIKTVVDAGAEVKGPEWRKDVLPAAFSTTVGLSIYPLGTNPLMAASVLVIGKSKTEGEKVMELDSSGFIEQLKDKIKDVKQAYATKVQAEQNYEIQKIDNKTDIEKAKNTLKLAEIDLEKYRLGDYVQALDDVKGRIETALSDLDDWKTRAAWSARQAKKGLVSKVAADADNSRVDAAKINVKKLQEEQRVLEKFTKGRTESDLQAKVKEALTNVEKTELQAVYKLLFLKADMDTKQAIYDLEVARQRDIEQQIANCTVHATQSGLVVYFVPDQVKGGGGSQQSIVAQGEPVRESQKMLQIPDLTHMLVNVRVPEAFVDYLHSEGKNKSEWQIAMVKVDAFRSRLLKGHVKFVDTVPSTQDWFAADVKVYKTIVAIDNPDNGDMPKLRPGMSAEVTITAEETGVPVLVVPIQAVIGTIAKGAERKCFVVGPDGYPVLRDITVGISNERLVEVRSGLAEGEKVVENPKPLLEDGSDLKPGKVKGKGDDAGGYVPGKGQDSGKPKQKGGKGLDPAKAGAFAPDIWLQVPDHPRVEVALAAPRGRELKIEN
jgi:HlyD family secretion protein